MSILIRRIATVLALSLPLAAVAQGNLEINTPAITALKNAMQSGHGQLAPGLRDDPRVVVHEGLNDVSGSGVARYQHFAAQGADLVDGDARAQQGDAEAQDRAAHEVDARPAARVLADEVHRHAQQQGEQHHRRAIVVGEPGGRQGHDDSDQAAGQDALSRAVEAQIAGRAGRRWAEDRDTLQRVEGGESELVLWRVVLRLSLIHI